MWMLVLSSLFADPMKPSALQWEITTASQSQHLAQLRQLDKKWNATVADGDGVKTDELVSIRRIAVPVPRFSQGPQIWLTNGDRMGGECLLCTANELLFHVEVSADRQAMQADQTIKLPRTSLGILWLQSFDRREMLLKYPWLKDRRKMDYVLLTNGDTIQGVLAGLDREKKELRMDKGGKTVLVPLARVHAVAFNTELTRSRIPATAFGNLVLRNGSRIKIAAAELKENQLLCETLLKRSIVFPLEEVVALDVYQGKAIYLSDMKPAQYEYHSYLGEKLGWGSDQTLDGRPFQLHHAQGDTTADKGIALHAPSTIRYALDSQYKRFEAVVGLNTRLGKHGSVQIQIHVDGKDVTPDALRTLTGSNRSVHVVVSVEKAKSLVLVVEMGTGGNVNDHVDWGDARLIR